jgi:uncharacterized membrane protein (DUF4010 family)
MDRLELFASLGVALGIGLLIGIERGWQSREESEGGRALGLRSFALSGLLGGIVGALAQTAGATSGILLGLAFTAFGLIVAFFRWRELEHEGIYGATTVVAALLTFALGAMAVLGDRVLAGACGVAAAGLLAFKPGLHAWLRRLTWPELRAGLVLLAMSVILLPVLPTEAPGPFSALNPREVWLMTIVIAAVSFAGYVAVKVAGDSIGVLVFGVAGGIASSAAATLSLMRLARDNPDQAARLAGGAAAAGVMMMLRVLVLAAAFNPAVAAELAAPLVLGALAQGGCAAMLMWRRSSGTQTPKLDLGNPFDLGAVLKFGLVLAVLMLVSRLMAARLGSVGAYLIAALSGLADADAITLSMSRLAGASLAPSVAAEAILIAVAVNTVVKAILGWMSANGRGGAWLVLAAALAVAAMAMGLMLDVGGWSRSLLSG